MKKSAEAKGRPNLQEDIVTEVKFWDAFFLMISAVDKPWRDSVFGADVHGFQFWMYR